MLRFTYQALPARVIFGAGSLERLPDEIQLLGASRALVLATPEQRDQAQAVAGRIGSRAVAVFAQATMHVPIATAVAAREEAKRLSADCCVTVGGGSTTGLAKAIALVLALPILAVPTTYAGSEMTPIWGLTEAGIKRTGRDPRALPGTVIYDPQLTVTLPLLLSATSGMNAVAHCVEALYAEDANPVISLMAEEGIRVLATSLPAVVKNPHEIEGRAQALHGARLAGASLGAVGMALHHKLCHVLGGTFDLPHAETHTVVVPYGLAYNWAAAPKAIARVARALGADHAAAGLYALAASMGAPASLGQIGMNESDLDRAADLAVESPYYNPTTCHSRGSSYVVGRCIPRASADTALTWSASHEERDLRVS